MWAAPIFASLPPFFQNSVKKCWKNPDLNWAVLLSLHHRGLEGSHNNSVSLYAIFSVFQTFFPFLAALCSQVSQHLIYFDIYLMVFKFDFGRRLSLLIIIIALVGRAPYHLELAVHIFITFFGAADRVSIFLFSCMFHQIVPNVVRHLHSNNKILSSVSNSFTHQSWIMNNFWIL